MTSHIARVRLAWGLAFLASGAGLVGLFQNLTSPGLVSAYEVSGDQLLEHDCSDPAPAGGADVEITLDGYKLLFDRKSGALARLSHPSFAPFLWAQQDQGSLFALSMPTQEFLATQLQPMKTHEPVIYRKVGNVPGICLFWSYLSSNRPNLRKSVGNTKAVVKIQSYRAAGGNRDGLRMQIQVRNHDHYSIHQVLFPYLSGLQPISLTAGANQSNSMTVITPTDSFIPYGAAALSEDRTPFYPHAIWKRMQLADAFTIIDPTTSSVGHVQPVVQQERHIAAVEGCGGNGYFIQELAGAGPLVPTEILVRRDEEDGGVRMAFRIGQKIGSDQVWTSRAFLLAVKDIGSCP